MKRKGIHVQREGQSHQFTFYTLLISKDVELRKYSFYVLTTMEDFMKMTNSRLIR